MKNKLDLNFKNSNKTRYKFFIYNFQKPLKNSLNFQTKTDYKFILNFL